ncbi:MAG: HD domain-containing phosphohydrolase [Phycisphaeraceae bacterium]
MLRIDTTHAKPGMRLALPVQNPQAPGKALLKVGYALTPQIIDRLRGYGIRSVWVQYPSLAFLEEIIDPETARCQSEIVANVAETFESLQRQSSAKLAYATYTQSLKHLIENLASHPQSMLFLGDLADAADDLMRHSSSVTYLAVLMGMKLEAYLVRERRHVSPERAKEVTNLGLGAMLHDVGIMDLEPDVRQRFDETLDESDEAWQQHPALGFNLVRGHVDASAATVVLNHHQHYDGTGFAGGDYPVLMERQTHVFARITAVADQFDRLRSPANLPRQPTAWVLRAMVNDPLASRFDPQALRALVTVVPPYPPGSMVQLSDRRWAVVIDHHPDAPCRPTVQIMPEPEAMGDEDLTLGETIDLREAFGSLHVAQHDGQDVTGVNFELAETSRAGDLAAW